MISVIIPVVRPESARRCIQAITADATSVSSFGERWPQFIGETGLHIEVVSREDEDRIGCPEMVKQLVAECAGEYICFLGDDTIPQLGFLDEALKVMATLPDGVGVVGFNTRPGNDHAHWIAHRDILPMIGGEFFHTGFHHAFCDDDLKERAAQLGRWAWAPGAKVEHMNPINRNADYDEHHERAYDHGKWEADRLLYVQRKRARSGFKLGIGFPLVDATIPVQFFTSFVCMDKGAEYSLFLPEFPHGPFTGDIAAARNSIVEQALLEGCTHLLMCDTDQVYPPDTLSRLMAHDKDVVGVRVHRRWPPFDVILYRGEVGRYNHVPDDECFSGDLVEVDATGTGCLLFKMEVFDHIERPWFHMEIRDGNPVGEDIYFCDKARKAGIGLFVDTSIEVGHLTTHTVGRGNYELFKHVNNFQWAEHGQGDQHG